MLCQFWDKHVSANVQIINPYLCPPDKLTLKEKRKRDGCIRIYKIGGGYCRGGTQEFELRSINFKKYISGLRSIFLFEKKDNFE